MPRPAGDILPATTGTFAGLVKRAIIAEGGDQLKEVVSGAIGTLNDPSTDATWPVDATHGKGFNVPEAGNAYVNFGDLADVGGGVETVMVLVRPDTATSPGIGTLARMVYKQGGGNDYCDITRAANDTFNTKFGVGTNFSASSQAVTWDPATTNLLGTSYDGTNQNTRADGVDGTPLDKSAAGSVTNDTTQDLLIGNDTGGNGAAGTIYAVVWFNVALTGPQWAELDADEWAWASAGAVVNPGLRIRAMQDQAGTTPSADETGIEVTVFNQAGTTQLTTTATAAVASGELELDDDLVGNPTDAVKARIYKAGVVEIYDEFTVVDLDATPTEYSD